MIGIELVERGVGDATPHSGRRGWVWGFRPHTIAQKNTPYGGCVFPVYYLLCTFFLTTTNPRRDTVARRANTPRWVLSPVVGGVGTGVGTGVGIGAGIKESVTSIGTITTLPENNPI